VSDSRSLRRSSAEGSCFPMGIASHGTPDKVCMAPMI
jgi:hypothetical protein